MRAGQAIHFHLGDHFASSLTLKHVTFSLPRSLLFFFLITEYCDVGHEWGLSIF